MSKNRQQQNHCKGEGKSVIDCECVKCTRYYEIIKNALEMSDKRLYFEIDHYWKRATYFWVFIALAFTSYFSIVIANNHTIVNSINHEIVDYNRYKLSISSIGFVLSLAWFYVNRGSKFWQNVWQIKVGKLENILYEELYSREIVPKKLELGFWLDKETRNAALERLMSQRPSLTQLNEHVSAFICSVWGILFVISFCNFLNIKVHCCEMIANVANNVDQWFPWAVLLFTLFFVYRIAVSTERH